MKQLFHTFLPGGLIMNMRKISTYGLFGIIVGISTYYVLSILNFVPYMVNGQELFIFILVIISVFLLYLTSMIEKIFKLKDSEKIQNLNLASLRDIGDSLPVVKDTIKGNLTQYFLGLQNFFKEAEDLHDLFDRLLVSTAKITRSERGSILLYDKKNDELYIYRTLGWEKSRFILAKDTRIHPGEGIAGRVFLDEKPLVINSLLRKDEFEQKKRYKSHAFVSFPISVRQQVIGILNLTEKSDNEYTNTEIDIVSFICNEVSILYLLHHSSK